MIKIITTFFQLLFSENSLVLCATIYVNMIIVLLCYRSAYPKKRFMDYVAKGGKIDWIIDTAQEALIWTVLMDAAYCLWVAIKHYR